MTTPAPRGWERATSLSLTEAAAVLCCSRSKAYLLADTGTLPTFRDHLGDRRVRPADLQVVLAQQGEQADLFSGATP